jgi:hypothetical protein
MSEQQITEMGFKGFRTWPNVIVLDLVGLAIVVDWTHKTVGIRMRYANLNTGAVSMIFDL